MSEIRRLIDQDRIGLDAYRDSGRLYLVNAAEEELNRLYRELGDLQVRVRTLEDRIKTACTSTRLAYRILDELTGKEEK